MSEPNLSARRRHVRKLFIAGTLFTPGVIAQICLAYPNTTERDVRNELRAIRKELLRKVQR
jgi:hypothetical protein